MLGGSGAVISRVLKTQIGSKNGYYTESPPCSYPNEPPSAEMGSGQV